jgi:hypothetical protein
MAAKKSTKKAAPKSVKKYPVKKPASQSSEKRDNQILAVALIAAVVVSGYYLFISKQKSEKQLMEASRHLSDQKKIVVTLDELSKSKQTGLVSLTEEEGKIAVALDITNSVKSLAQPAHIHSGSCPTPGEPVYTLTNTVDGKSLTTLETNLADLRAKAPLSIMVHKSTKDHTSVACGNIAFE